MNFKINKIVKDAEEDYMLTDHFFSSEFVEIGQEKFVLPERFLDYWQKVKNFEVRNDDVFITGHPKTGTTWLYEIVNCIMNGWNTKREIGDLFRGLPLVEFSIIFPPQNVSRHRQNFKEELNVDAWESPRIIKTHLPWFLIPEQIQLEAKTPKIIHILRDPKDVCVSYYYLLHGHTGNFQHFCKLFLKGRLIWGPYHATVKSYWEQRDRPNVLLVKYSELKRNPHATVEKIATFLGKPLRDDDVAQIVARTTFDTMKSNLGLKLDEVMRTLMTLDGKDVGKIDFLRQGKEGSYATIMRDDVVREFDNVFGSELEGTGITF